MLLFATLTVLLLVRFVLSGRPVWLYGTGAAMGLTFLSKETSIVLLGAIYAFLALTPELRVRLRDLAISLGVMALVIAPFPLTLMLAGRTGTGESYLTWQLFQAPQPRLALLPDDGAAGGRAAGAGGGCGGTLAAAARGFLEGDAASVLDRRAGGLLLSLAGQGLPVPASGRASARASRRPRTHAAALAPVPGPCRPWRRDDRRAQRARPHLAAHRRRAARDLPRRLGWASRRARGRQLDRAQRPARCRLHDDRALDGQPRAVLRPPQGLRPLGQPQSAQPQPVLRAAGQPRSSAARERAPVHRLGHLLGHPVAELLREAAAAMRTATTAGSSTPRCFRPGPRWARARTGRPSWSSRCGRETGRGARVGPRLRAGRSGGREEPAGDADRALRRADAGEPLVRQPLRHLSGRRRDPARHLHARRAPRTALRAAVPSRRPRGPQPRSRPQDPPASVRRRTHGRLRPGGVGGPPDRRALGDGLLRRPRPALLLERGRRVRAVRPLLRRHRAGSVASHLLWVAGTPGRADGGVQDRPTIFDRLEERGISWKFYVEDYDPRRAAQAVRVPLLRMPRFVRDARLLGHIVDLDEYYEDLRADRLPGGRLHRPGRLERASAGTDRSGRGPRQEVDRRRCR